MFTPDERTRIRESLVLDAEQDPRIVGAALVGSAARDEEDRWSDIDLALQLAGAVDEPRVVEDWTARIDDAFGLADTLDVMAAGVRYRVLLLRSSLQIDLSFWPFERFRASSTGFTTLFGEPGDPVTPAHPDVDRTIGMAWLYAIHARSAIARGRLWQGVMMLDELRDAIVELMCVRADVEAHHGRGVDRLPVEDRDALAAGRAADVTADALEASRRRLTALLLAEIGEHDAGRVERLRAPFDELLRAEG